MKLQTVFLVTTFLILCPLALAGNCCKVANKSSKDCNSLPASPVKNGRLDDILKNIGKASSSLDTCECTLSYLFIQDPELINSRTLRTGKLYYRKVKERSQLRIRFERLQQDDFEPQETIEDYYFDGVWVTKIDYKLEQIDLYQQVPENEPVDVFELINHRFPLIGFSGAEALQKDFDISLVEAPNTEPNEPIQLLLHVKEDSKYQKEYKKIDFWINRDDYLPSRVKAYSTQGDIYDTRFLDIQVNKKLKNGVFTVETPADFRKNIQPLETATETKGN